MSTVLEVIQARALEMEVAGFSCMANLAIGLSSTVLSHDQVLETSHKAAKDFSRILRAAVPNL
jgi:purine-nucleoside phosphorylase